MGFIPVQPQKTRELRDRYRKTRRRQQAYMLLGGCGLLTVVLLVTTVIMLATQGKRPTQPTAKPPAADKPASAKVSEVAAEQTTRLPSFDAVALAASQKLEPAPWLLDIDGDSLICLSDSQGRSGEQDVYYPADKLSALPLRGGKPLWSLEDADYSAVDLDCGAGCALTLTRKLADQQLIVTSFSTTDGRILWQHIIERVEGGTLDVVGQQAIVLYKKDGWRLVCYNAHSGVKAWGLKLPLRGLRSALVSGTSSPRPQLFSYGNALLYLYGNVLGIADRQTGKLRRNELETSGLITGFVTDAESQRAFITVRGNQAGSSTIFAVPLDGSRASEVLVIRDAQSSVFVVPSAHWLLAAYARTVQGVPELLLEGRLLGEDSGQSFSQTLPAGQLACGAALPGTRSTFLIGVAVEQQEHSQMALAGARQFYTVNPATGRLERAGRAAQPVYSLLVFRNNVLAVCDDGEVQRFDPGRRAFRRVWKPRHSQLQLLQSDDRTSLVVLATTEDFFKGAGRQPMQLAAIR